MPAGGRSGRGAAGRGGGALRRSTDCRKTPMPAPSGFGTSRAKPGEFVADEVSLLIRDQPYQVRCLIARTRRTGRPAHRVGRLPAGDVDAEQVRVIDRVAAGSPNPTP